MSVHHSHKENEKKTRWVVLLTASTMVVEIIFGISTHSMALLADGIHMGSHVLAIGLSWGAYVFIRKRMHVYGRNLNEGNVLSLTGFTSGLLLLIFACIIIIEALGRFVSPREISYNEAIYVAIIGLIVNIVSAMLLHHKHDQSDQNIRAAYLHVLADALTSVAAIIGLISAMIWGIAFIDTIAALVSSMVIIRWSLGLLRDSGKAIIMNPH